MIYIFYAEICIVHANVPGSIFCRWAPNWFLKSSERRFACSIVRRVFRGCSAAVARPSGLLFAVQLFRLARPHKMVPLLLITLIFIYYGEICGGAIVKENNGSEGSDSKRCSAEVSAVSARVSAEKSASILRPQKYGRFERKVQNRCFQGNAQKMLRGSVRAN